MGNITISLPTDLILKLESLSSHRGEKKSNVACKAINMWVELHNPDSSVWVEAIETLSKIMRVYGRKVKIERISDDEKGSPSGTLS